MAEAQGTGGLDAALAQVGGRWTLQIIDALLGGPRRFGELQPALGGIATNVLAQRLRHLESQGVVVSTPYSTRPRRHAYQLTQAGRELAGALLLLTRWGSDHTTGANGEHGPHHQACGTPLEPRWYCPTCDRTIHDEESDLDTLRWV